jgi:hypothetical protein
MTDPPVQSPPAQARAPARPGGTGALVVAAACTFFAVLVSLPTLTYSLLTLVYLAICTDDLAGSFWTVSDEANCWPWRSWALLSVVLVMTGYALITMGWIRRRRRLSVAGVLVVCLPYPVLVLLVQTGIMSSAP